QRRVTAGRPVSAVEGRAPAPAAAAGQRTLLLDHEIGSIVDQLSVDAHDGPAGSDLIRTEKRLLELGDGALHQRGQGGDVLAASQPMREGLIGHLRPRYRASTMNSSRRRARAQWPSQI